MDKNRAGEEHLQQEGRLKLLKSEMNRVSQNRNSTKELWPVDDQLADHKKRVNRSLNELQRKNPQASKYLRIASVLPV